MTECIKADPPNLEDFLVKAEYPSSQPIHQRFARRAESTDETRSVRKSSIKPSESLDGSKHEGILRRKRSCLVKTVSFSTTVSELTLPAEPEMKKDHGEYVETKFDVTDNATEVMLMPKEEEPPRRVSLSAREEKARDTKQHGQLKERRNKCSELRKVEQKAKNEWKPLTVEDLPEDEDPDEFGISEVYKCGNCLIGFAPVKKKKLMFVTLTERCLELHESEKSYRAGKAAKHMVDLSMSFNVHSEHYDAKLKKCLCLMGPDETICMRPEGGILTIEGWRRAIVKMIHASRRGKMDRTPRPEDIFDAVYDIRVCIAPKNVEKYAQTLKEDGITNICTVVKELLGKKRLCLYPNTLAICDLCIEPTAYGLPPAGYPPFRASNMFILERSTVAFYGFRDNYFYVRIGKGSPYRGFEILFMVDTPDVCKEIYTRLKNLIARDLENRKQESIRRNEASDMHGMESLLVPSPLSHRTKLSLDSPVLTARDRRLMLGRDCLSFASVERDDSAPSSPFANYNRPRGSLGNFQLDHLRFEQPRGSLHSLGNVPIDRLRLGTQQPVKQVKEELGLREALFEAYPHLKKKHSTQSERGEIVIPEQERKMSDNFTRRKTQEMNPDSNPNFNQEEPVKPKLPPLKFNINKPSGELLMSLQREKEQMEEAKRNEHVGRTYNTNGTPRESRKDFLDASAGSQHHIAVPEKVKNNDTYTLMGPADWGKAEDVVKDDYSDSGDSCYSSRRGTASHQSRPMQAQLVSQMHNRAQSFGAKQFNCQNRLPPTVNLPDSERKISAVTHGSANQLDLPDDDPRKRAFSLGSKNFFNMIGLNDFRRLVGKRHRTTSPSHTSNSRISLNSSNASPSSGSVNFLASNDHLDRTRTESFGSGRNSPSRSQPLSRVSYGSPKKKSNDDLVTIDFSKLGKKNSTVDTNRYPFGGGPAGSFDYDREKREKEENDRKELERKAMELKRKEEMEAKELIERKREKELRNLEKKEKKLEKERMKEREKEREKEQDCDKDKDFRPKADSGIADCTPSSSFSGTKTGKNDDNCDSAYIDAEGLKFLADIKKRKKEQGNVDTSTSSSSSLNTVVLVEDNKANKTAVSPQIMKTTAVEINRKPSSCAELNRKPSVCTAIMEENEGATSETDSRGEPADRKPAPVTRKPASTGSSMSPFRRLKFLSFRK